MKRVTITNQLNIEEYEEIRLLYFQFYSETLNLERYSEGEITDKADSATHRALDRREETVSFWAARDEETAEIIGFAKAKTYPDGVGVFNHIFVKPEYRAASFEIGDKPTKIFLALNDTIVDWFLSSGIHTIEVETTKRQPKLIEVGERTDFQVVREFQDTILLRKSLLKSPSSPSEE